MQIQNRRTFFINLTRYTVLTALGLGAGRHVIKSLQADCPNDSVCERCRRLAHCEQPQAIAKRTEKESDHGR